MKTTRKKLPKRRESMRYLVMIRRTATGYSVDVPDVPGCIAVAKTVRGARLMIAKALAFHFELMCESGETIPLPSQSIHFAVDETSDEEFCTWVEVAMPATMLSHS
jgi:predicted RNase H-like HicB family nuclease